MSTPEGAYPAPVPVEPEDYYPQIVGGASTGCDTRGGIGYGRLLVDGGVPLRDVSTWNGQFLEGTFTVWVRRPLLPESNGTFKDETDNALVVVTVMGTAPYSDPAVAARLGLAEAESGEGGA